MLQYGIVQDLAIHIETYDNPYLTAKAFFCITLYGSANDLSAFLGRINLEGITIGGDGHIDVLSRFVVELGSNGFNRFLQGGRFGYRYRAGGKLVHSG